MKTTYVIGHRNPDTDSIVSAIAYAELKRQLGWKNCIAARAGKLTPQTEYILDRFNIQPPVYIPDLIPKVGYYTNPNPVTVSKMTSLLTALEKMEKENVKILPVTSSDGRFRAVLNYNAFASNITKKIHPNRKSIIPTSTNLLLETLKAQPVVSFGGDEVMRSRIVVGASSKESFELQLRSEIPTNAIVLTGDREDIQRISVEQGVRALVIINGMTPAKGIRELAEKKGVTVMISPYDTSSTAFLILYSTPVSTMADTTAKCVNVNSYVRSVRELLDATPSHCVPVVDDAQKVVGVLSENDLLDDANIDVIMVDHNELTQAVEGLENYKILEILDHHRLGNFATRYPITFINRVVGATATIIASMYVEQKAVLTPKIAALLLAGILTDTLMLRSATTTDVDREMADYLGGLVDIDIETLGEDIFNSSRLLSNVKDVDLLNMDSKKYTACRKQFSVSQVEVNGTSDDLLHRKENIAAALAQKRQREGLYFAALMITDITALNSILMIDGDEEFLRHIVFPKMEDHIYICRDILSRKKQLIPLLIEQMENVLGADNRPSSSMR